MIRHNILLVGILVIASYYPPQQDHHQQYAAFILVNCWQPQYQYKYQHVRERRKQRNQSFSFSAFSSSNNVDTVAHPHNSHDHEYESTTSSSFRTKTTTTRPSSSPSIDVISESCRRSFFKNVITRTSMIAACTITATATVTMPEMALAQIDVSGLRVAPLQQSEQSAAPPQSIGQPISSTVTTTTTNKLQSIELGGISYTPAAMILQIAEQTASMEGMMRYSVKDIQDGKSLQQRIENGSNGIGPGAIRRQDLIQSITVMIRNSQLQYIAPKATTILDEIPVFLNKNASDNSMSLMEYQIVASKYEQARNELKVVFDAFPIEIQTEGKQFMRNERAKDVERMKKQQQQVQ